MGKDLKGKENDVILKIQEQKKLQGILGHSNVGITINCVVKYRERQKSLIYRGFWIGLT